jgi:hypothetical protein
MRRTIPILILLLISFNSMAQKSHNKSIFTFLFKKKPVKCKCIIEKDGVIIKQLTTDVLDLTEYCGDENIEISYEPVDEYFSGNVIVCESANPIINVGVAEYAKNLNINGFKLLDQDTSRRYKWIAAATQNELAQIARIHGQEAKAMEFQSTAVALFVEAMHADKNLVLNKDTEQGETVLNEIGIVLLKTLQEKLGIAVDGKLGPETLSEAAQIKTPWLYSNTEWQKNKVNTAIAF